MPKHRIEATTSVCRGAGHNWQDSLAPNYRVCRSCRSVEMFIDGQWVSPTARPKRSTDEIVSLPLVQPAEQGREVQAISAVEVLLSSVSVVTKRRELGDRLYAWGVEHDFPQLRVQMPGCGYTIVPGQAIWRMICYQSPSRIIEAAVEQVSSYRGLAIAEGVEREQREKLLELGRARDWQLFTFKTSKPEALGSSYQFSLVIGAGESKWQRFVCLGDYRHVCQACDLLVQEGAVKE